jgi:hypothetical protein
VLRYQPILFDANYHGLNAVASTEIRARCGVQAAVLRYQPILFDANYHGLNAVASTEILATLRRSGRSASLPANSV